MKEIISRITETDYFVRWYSSHQDLGMWPGKQAGGVAEFETISEYELGDNPRSINWPATARTGGHTILKNTRMTEAKISLFILVDLSRSMDFGTVRVTKRRLAAEISASLVHAAWRCRDQVGFIAYGSEVDVMWPLRNPKDYRLLIPKKILDTRSSGKTGTGLAEALSKLPVKRSLVFLISDFQEPIKEIKKAFKSFVFRHDVIPVIISDPREKVLPKRRCLTVLKDLETGRKKTIWLGGSRKRLAFKKQSEERECKLRRLFQRLGMKALWVHQETDLAQEMSRFFMIRRRAN
jgi:uncharacterized protein (DUF58 family)